MNLPNKLTILRVFLIPVFLFFLLFEINYGRQISLLIFVIASSTDALDGYIARKHNLITNFGKFMDPLADKLLVCAALIALTYLGDIPVLLVILIISREFIITGFRTLAADSNIVIAASNWGKIKTITQMVMIIYFLIGLNFGIFVLIGNILIGLSALSTIISGMEYIYKNKQVLK